MAWEQHGRRAYYYKKVRTGSKVKSIYVGKGELAELISGIDDAIRRAQKAVRASKKPNSHRPRLSGHAYANENYRNNQHPQRIRIYCGQI